MSTNAKMMNKKIKYTMLCIILFAAFTLRLFCLFAYPQPVTGDSPEYDKLALNFIQGEGLIAGPNIASRTPVYPLFLALLYRIFGHNYNLVYIAQIFLDLFTMVIIYLIGLKVFRDVKLSLLSMLLFALYPSFILYAVTLISESLFTFIISLFALILTMAVEKKSIIYFFLSGLLLGLAGLCRPVAQMLFFIFAALIIFYHRRISKVVLLKQILVYTIGFCLILAPWVARNYILLKSFVPSTTSVGSHFFYANVPIDSDDFLGETTYAKYDDALKAYGIGNYAEVEMDKILFKKTVELISRHPFRYILISFNRLMRLWLNVGYGYSPSTLAWLVMFGQILVLGVLGVCIIFFRKEIPASSAPLWIIILYFTVVYSLVHAAYRYIVPIMPYPLMFNAYALIQIFKEFRT